MVVRATGLGTETVFAGAIVDVRGPGVKTPGIGSVDTPGLGNSTEPTYVVQREITNCKVLRGRKVDDVPPSGLREARDYTDGAHRALLQIRCRHEIEITHVFLERTQLIFAALA